MSDDTCFRFTVDQSSYHGHLYSNKAPGMSLLEIFPAQAVNLPTPIQWTHDPDLRLWVVHLFAAGIPFLLCVFLIGRISEGIVPGFGAPAMVTFALGTVAAQMAIAGFDHMPAAGLGFLAFVLSWRRCPLAAGLAAGAALTTEYQAAAIVLILLAYTALHGRRAILRYVVGVAPGAALLAAYDWVSFGAPWHNPISYDVKQYPGVTMGETAGVHMPNAHSAWLVFGGNRGLLVVSPVLIPAAAGLWLLWRRGLRAEAAVCATVTAAFVLGECGYGDPYGGRSPGLRYLIPCLPFLALGLAPAFARWRTAMTVLAGVSVIATTAITLTWMNIGSYRNTVWGEIGRLFAQGGSSRFARGLAKDVLVWGPNRMIGAAVVASLAAAAFAIGCGAGRRAEPVPVAGATDIA